ncbi:MAG: hypothetical protein HQ541_16175 [Mariniphaga sp.]|nr:hypothetical protein [Mariniphaga sp.]
MRREEPIAIYNVDTNLIKENLDEIFRILKLSDKYTSDNIYRIICLAKLKIVNSEIIGKFELYYSDKKIIEKSNNEFVPTVLWNRAVELRELTNSLINTLRS